MKPLIALALIVAGLGFAGVSLFRHKRESPNFRSRAAVVSGRVWVQDTIPSAVIQEHQAVADNVLLIHNATLFDNGGDFDSEPQPDKKADGIWSFASIICRALKQSCSPGSYQPAQMVMQEWLDKLTDRKEPRSPTYIPAFRFQEDWRNSDSNFALDRAPVHLLGISNRLDQAILDPSSGKMCRAEVRFDFAALSDNYPEPYLDLIVEFVGPCVSKQEFKASAQRWSELKDKTGAAYLAAFEKILDAGVSQAVYARLRINAGPTGSSTWTSREFRFEQGAIRPRDLEREFNAKLGDCQGASSLAGVYLQTPGKLDRVLASDYDLENSGLQTLVNTISLQVRGVLTLGSDLLQDGQRDDARFAMSINSCASCHGPETGTEFHHLNQRTTGESSKLSAFLTGSEDCRPGGSTGKTTYCTVKPPIMKTCNVTAKPRQYNDLLRRHLFLYTVLQLDPNAPNGLWRNKLGPFTSYQSH